jgi:RHS repeat-associated protein
MEYVWLGSGWYPNGETRYIYDGRLVIQERNGSNTPQVSYTRGIDLSGTLEVSGGIGGLLARSHGYSGGSWSYNNFYHADGNGNVTYVVNSSQGLAALYRYDPYGRLLYSSGSLAGANVYRFSSKEIHVNSGLYYYGYRFYDPNLQRWLSRDPLGEESAINLYEFVGNNPVAQLDPDGLTCYRNAKFFIQWSLGLGESERYYGENTTETKEMKNSPGGRAMRKQFYKEGCKTFKVGKFGHWAAYFNTVVIPRWCNTAFQVGGFYGATATDNGDGTVTFCIPNVAGTESFFYGVFPNMPWKKGPMRNITQTFCWTEKIDKCKCK